MIAVLPYVTHPKTAVLGRAGGVLEDLGSKSIEGNLQGVLSIYGR